MGGISKAGLAKPPGAASQTRRTLQAKAGTAYRCLQAPASGAATRRDQLTGPARTTAQLTQDGIMVLGSSSHNNPC